MTRPIDMQRAIELIQAGRTIPWIMEELDCSRWAVLKLRKQIGAANQAYEPVNDELVAELTRAGMSATQIAERLKCAERTVQRARVRTGIAKTSPTMRRLTPEEIIEVEQLLEQGCSLQEASRSIGRHPDALYKNTRFTQWRWSKQECAEFAAFCSRMAKAGAKFSVRADV